jgi:alcohol dehydrogenase class IV
MNLKRLEQLGAEGKNGLLKYAIVGALIAGKESYEDINNSHYCSVLIEILENWTKQLNFDRLGKYGIVTTDIDDIVEKTSLKNNPVHLKRRDLNEILKSRI